MYRLGPRPQEKRSFRDVAQRIPGVLGQDALLGSSGSMGGRGERGVRVWGMGYGVWGLGFWVLGFGLRVSGSDLPEKPRSP